MKRILTLMLLISIAGICFSAFAKVRFYVSTKYYSRDGIQESVNPPKRRYYAFINNNSIIYECDANGNAKTDILGRPSTLRYKYIRTSGDVFIYQQYSPGIQTMWGYTGDAMGISFLYVSSDFRRINDKLCDNCGTYVFEQKDPNSSTVEAPVQMY